MFKFAYFQSPFASILRFLMLRARMISNQISTFLKCSTSENVYCTPVVTKNVAQKFHRTASRRKGFDWCKICALKMFEDFKSTENKFSSYTFAADVNSMLVKLLVFFHFDNWARKPLHKFFHSSETFVRNSICVLSAELYILTSRARKTTFQTKST